MVSLEEMLKSSKKVIKHDFEKARKIGNAPKDAGKAENVLVTVDSMGGAALYVIDEHGGRYSPYYAQDGREAHEQCYDEEWGLDEDCILIGLAGATDWENWKWVKQ